MKGGKSIGEFKPQAEKGNFEHQYLSVVRLARFRTGNGIKLLKTGNEYFPVLLQAIYNASVEIYLESYIFADDQTGRNVLQALIHVLHRGVAVRVLVDGFGSAEFQEELSNQLCAAGGELLVFRPEVARFSMRRSRLRRMHRKLAVIDGHTAFVGGINIISETIPPRLDYALQIQGPILQDIQLAVRRLWRSVRLTALNPPLAPVPRLPAQVDSSGKSTAAFLIRSNVLHRRSIENAYLHAIANSRQEVWIACAYFLPGRHFRNALTEAARRGVEVRLLLQGKAEADHRLQYFATQALYGVLIGEGVRCFEYNKSLMHAKAAVVDDNWATVGSSNIDPFSLLMAREANVVLNDEEFARELKRNLKLDIGEGAVEIKASDLRKRSLLVRLLNWLAYGSMRVFVGICGAWRDEDRQEHL